MSITRQAVTYIQESWRFESMYTMQGKPDTHDTYAFCANPHMPFVHFLSAIPVRATFRKVINRVKRIHYP
jgi:hypothetical protein